MLDNLVINKKIKLADNLVISEKYNNFYYITEYRHLFEHTRQH